MLEKIEQGIMFLMEKDIPLAKKFLKQRNFQSLIDLVSSTRSRIIRYRNRVGYDEYNKLDMDELTTLQTLIELYAMNTGLLTEDDNGELI